LESRLGLEKVSSQKSIKPYDEAIRAQLARILNSPGFVNSPRRSQFLSYIVEATLRGRSDDLTEYAIGFTVFGRPESFDPRLDSIVRVYATNVRKALRAYYRTQGVSDPVIIDVPTGTYLPVFKLSAKDVVAASRSAPTMAIVPAATLNASDSAFTLGVCDETINTVVDAGKFNVVANSYVPGVSYGRNFAARLQDIGITVLVEITARRHRGTIRVTARLVEPHTGYIKWKTHCDSELNDTLAAQEAVAKKIVHSLAGYLECAFGAAKSQASN
jgi:TolB-like protein